MSPHPILGHYWGIDEIGVFVIPALVVVAVLRRAERRARDRASSDHDTDTDA